MLRQTLEEEKRAREQEEQPRDAINNATEAQSDFTNDKDPLTALELKAQEAISNMLDDHKLHVGSNDVPTNVNLIVEYSENTTFKSTLVSELNRNSFLSKDRLTYVRNSIYFNNVDDYLSAANSSSTYLLGLESDCAVFMMQRVSTRQSSASKVAGKQGQQKKGPIGPSNIYGGVNEGYWWLRCVQKIRRKISNRRCNSRVPLDLMNRPVGKKSATSSTQKVRLNWFFMANGNLKFKYDHFDCKWVDVDSIISTMTLIFPPRPKLYFLKQDDYESLQEFVKS